MVRSGAASCVAGVLLAVFGGATSARAQQPTPPASAQPFAAGPALKTSPNVKVFGSFRFAESISYDPDRDLYVVVLTNRVHPTREGDGIQDIRRAVHDAIATGLDDERPA